MRRNRRGGLPRAGGVAALLAAFLLVIGVAGFAVEWPGFRPWLAVLFGINAGLGDVSLVSLRVVSLMDLLLLVLTGVTFIGFWPGPSKPHKVWMGLAIALPFAGIAVLIATGVAGRSGLMGGGLVLSFLMLGDRKYRPMGYVGIAVNSLLLVADFATSGSRSVLIAGLVAAGYLLLVVWLLLLAARLLRKAVRRSPPLHA